MYIEDLLRERPLIHSLCQQIVKRPISDRSWYDWERLAGASGKQVHGRKLQKRKYTDEQIERLLLIAHVRKVHPKLKLTYKIVTEFQQTQEYQLKLNLVYDTFIAQDNVRQTTEQQLPEASWKLSQIKRACDRVMDRRIHREVFAAWKQHLGIERYARSGSEAEAALLVQMAIFRKDNPNKRFPRVQALVAMMQSHRQRAMTLETASASKTQHKWAMTGCKGKELRSYLASLGLKIAESTLYRWGGYQRKRHYHTWELAQWVERVQSAQY